MFTRFALGLLLLGSALVVAPASVSAQATCVDATGDACLNVVRAARPDGVVDDIFTTRDGLFAPQLGFATYVRGVNGCIGFTHTPTILEGYTCGSAGTAPPGGDDPSFQANSLDWYWTQVLRTRDTAGTLVDDGEAGFYEPTRGRVYDLGGEANRVVLFPITDHAPLPCEAFEYTVWLSNDPDSTVTATPEAPDPRAWNPARLIRAYTQGWTRNAAATGVAEAGRADLATWLRDNSGGEAVADALATVWALPCGLSFRYVSIQAGNNGNPGPECAFHSQDDELDAVAGLNEDDTAICLDADGDGHRAATCGGSDCDDTDPAVHPGAFEPCDSPRDLDCEPATECPMGTACDSSSGLCVSACFEGGCGPGDTCTDTGLCVESACAMRAEPCPEGTICRAGECLAPCEGVVCPRGEVCTSGACIDPCAGVVCPASQVCIAGEPGALTLCGPACTCEDISIPLCAADRACDERPDSETLGSCVDPGCETMTCAATEVCVGGTCIDACVGVMCPLDQVCVDGRCGRDPCDGVRCPGTATCVGGECVGGCEDVMCPDRQRCIAGECVALPCPEEPCFVGFTCVAGECVDESEDTGRSDGGRDAGPGAESGGCCRVGGGGGDPSGAMLVTLALGAILLRRRRR